MVNVSSLDWKNDENEKESLSVIWWYSTQNALVSSADDVSDDFILMQSTGLFDANGREVFAGDIVLINRPPFDCQGVVKYYNGCWWIVCGGIAFSLYDEVEESLVIGNIYENKELLEGTE
ncbi:MAG: YopX family protein [Streptococcus hyointestinalis]|nr:YopX family protein [Streptococcus hyointestinalis]MDD6383950.1 YopX family protein [Streptococcus hyointestinalis]